MLGELDQVVDAHFIYREIKVDRLIELLNEAKQYSWNDLRVCTNRVGNLTVMDKNDRSIGYIDIGAEDFVEF